jgi:hypothetical protein
VFLAIGVRFTITCILTSYITGCILKVFILDIIAATLRKLIVLNYIAVFLISTILNVY